MARKQTVDALKAHFMPLMGDAERVALASALADLFDGPSVDAEMGFESACKVLSGWLVDLPSEVYVDTDSDCVCESEPEQDDGGTWVYVYQRYEARAVRSLGRVRLGRTVL